MIDFTAALYLGMRHASATLPPWNSFTTGRPAALGELQYAREVAAQLARLQGCEAGVLAPSTLHLFWDLFGMLPQTVAIFLDAGAYPIARWGVERARARGLPVMPFAHYNPTALGDGLRRSAHGRRRPLVVTDGFCPGCGQPVPLIDYMECLAPYGGRLLIDDTQALGILGHSPSAETAYGWGGGGTLRWYGVADDTISVVASLAKSFGAPIAALSGRGALVGYFVRRSQTRVHASPPSIADVHAAGSALTRNRRSGERLRSQLLQRVRRFRAGLSRWGLRARGGMFPVQTLAGLSGVAAQELHGRLRRQGVRTVLQAGRPPRGAQVSFLIGVHHDLKAIDSAVATLANEWANLKLCQEHCHDPYDLAI